MKKILIAALLLLVFSAAGVFGQSGFLNVDEYSLPFLNEFNSINDKYVFAPTNYDELEKIAGLSKEADDIDTPLEIALLSYAAGVIPIRPPEADAILPASDPRLSGLKLGAATYKELVELRFLDPSNTAAIGRYEDMLRFIGNANGVTRTEIEAYYRDNIGSLVSEIVDEEFGKISFSMDKGTDISYNAALIFNPQTKQYTLTYERPSLNNDDKAISAASLPELLALMRGNTADFDQNCINIVEEQAVLIPARVYARWLEAGVANRVDAVALIKRSITDFYRDPKPATIDILYGIYARYRLLTISGDKFAEITRESFYNTINSFNSALGVRMFSWTKGNGSGRTMVADAKIPNDRRFDIFSTRSDTLRVQPPPLTD